MKLKKATFKYIESEVYHLQETLHEIKMLENEIIHGSSIDLDSPRPGRNSVRNISDSTAQKATALSEHVSLKRMNEKTQAILNIYNKLIPEKKELIKLYYWERPGELTWDGVAKKLNIGKRTAIRWRKSFIYDVAKELGEQ